MTSSPQLDELLVKFESNVQTGLTSDQATHRREQDGCFNVVKPPVNCPGWICCLLPCIKGIPSMKAFAALKPDDAEVLRNSKWIRYDAASLVQGDIVRMEEGDTVPADCVLLDVPEEELLVDLRPVTGDERLKSVKSITVSSSGVQRLYMGGKVVQGGATAIITAIGPNTLLAKLIQEGRFPPKEPILEADEAGIAMGSLS